MITCCRCKKTDQSLVPNKPLWTGKYSYTMTLCQSCHSEASALMAEHPGAPYQALKQHRVPRSHPEWDDIVQFLNLTYWKCAVEFDATLGNKFGTYALRSLYHAVKTCLTQANTHGFTGVTRDIIDKGRRIDRPASMYCHRSERQREVKCRSEYDLDDELDAPDLHRLAWEAINKLPDRERFILNKRYRESWSLKQISDSLGITVFYVRKLEAKATERLKEELA